MQKLDCFAKLGLFVVKGFFDDSFCAELCLEICLRAKTKAMVTHGKEEIINDKFRKNEVAKVSESTISFVKSRLSLVKPALEEHFNQRLAGYQEPQFLAYEQGDFFLFHRDRSNKPDEPELVRARQISVVIFLNSEAKQHKKNAYTGGALNFYAYDLVNNPALEKSSFSLVGETGLLIAFRSDIRHQVQRITHGERFSIVSWFF